MSRDLSRRAFLERTACASALLALSRPISAADGMYVSLNGSLTRQMPWPDFVRLAGKLGYGGVDVNLNAAKTDGVDATLALLKEANVKPAVANLPLQFATPDEAAFQNGLKALPEHTQFADIVFASHQCTDVGKFSIDYLAECSPDFLLLCRGEESVPRFRADLATLDRS